MTEKYKSSHVWLLVDTMVTLKMSAIDVADSFESRYWLIAAILSRLLVTILIISSDYLIVDHFPGDDVAVFLVNHNVTSSLDNSALEMAFSPFTKWDSTFYLQIAKDRMYTNEQQFAFFPLYSFLVGSLGDALHYLLLTFRSKYYYTIDYFGIAHSVQYTVDSLLSVEYLSGLLVLSAVLISNISFIFSVGILRSLVERIIEKNPFLYSGVSRNDILLDQNKSSNMSKKEASSIRKQAIKIVPPNNCSTSSGNFEEYQLYRKKKLLDYAIFCYIFNPASVFFSSVYTESLYSLLTFSGLYVLDLAWNQDSKHDNILFDSRNLINKIISLITHCRLQMFYLIFIILVAYTFSLASSTRSNGMLNGIFSGFFIISHILITVFGDFSNGIVSAGKSDENFNFEMPNDAVIKIGIVMENVHDNNDKNSYNNNIDTINSNNSTDNNCNDNHDNNDNCPIKKKLKFQISAAIDHKLLNDATKIKKNKYFPITFITLFSILTYSIYFSLLLISPILPYFIANEYMKAITCFGSSDSCQFNFVQKFVLPFNKNRAGLSLGSALWPGIILYEQSLNGPMGRSDNMGQNDHQNKIAIQDYASKKRRIIFKNEKEIKNINHSENKEENEIIEKSFIYNYLDNDEDKFSMDLLQNMRSEEKHISISKAVCENDLNYCNNSKSDSDVSSSGISDNDVSSSTCIQRNSDSTVESNSFLCNENNKKHHNFCNEDGNGSYNIKNKENNNLQNCENKCYLYYEKDIEKSAFSIYDLFSYHDMYSKIQRKYWNVGFLRYYQIKQIPNFILSFPILSISYFTIRYCTVLFIRSKIYENISLYGDSGVFFSRKNGKFFWFIILGILENSISAHIFHLFVVTLLGLFIAHIQIVTRLICSSCPIIYIGFAVLLNNSDEELILKFKAEKLNIMKSEESSTLGLENNSKKEKKSKIFSTSASSSSHRLKFFVIFYLILYIFLGILLHPNFYPWT